MFQLHLGASLCSERSALCLVGREGEREGGGGESSVREVQRGAQGTTAPISDLLDCSGKIPRGCREELAVSRQVRGGEGSMFYKNVPVSHWRSSSREPWGPPSPTRDTRPAWMPDVRPREAVLSLTLSLSEMG